LASDPAPGLGAFYGSSLGRTQVVKQKIALEKTWRICSHSWVQARNHTSDQIRDQIWDRVWEQVRIQVEDQVREQIWWQLTEELK